MNESLEECLALMRTLVRCRKDPITVPLRAIRHKHSMMHDDVLLLIYHLSKTVAGNILEIGPYLGGSTIAAGLGARASGESKTIVTVEPGGQLKHPRLPSKNILRDLKRNLAKQDLDDQVVVIEGYSAKEETIAAVRRHLSLGSVGLFIFDADAGFERDLHLYGDLLADRAWVIADDYFSPDGNEKAVRVRPQVDALVAAGKLQALGIYGWGSWLGRVAKA